MLTTVRKWIPILLIAVVCPAFGDTREFEAAKLSMKDMFLIENRTVVYFMFNNQKYPAARSMTELAKELESVTKQLRNKVIPIKDAWGNEFQYRCDSERRNMWIISYGSDGKPDSGIYDASGIPNKDEFSPTSDPQSDIILLNGKFILRNPAAEKAALDEIKEEFKNGTWSQR